MKLEDMENINEKFHLLVDGLNALWSQFILAWREALDPDLESEDEIVVKETITKSNLQKEAESIFPPNIEGKEHIIQDLTGITILDKLPRSYLIFKNGYTAIVAYSHLKFGDRFEKGFRGDINDDLFDNRKWILKTKKDGTPNLEWRPFGEGK